jgi:hypothetical protein
MSRFRIELVRVNQLGLARHHLTPGTKTDDLVQIAGDVGGLHATGVTTPYLSLLARTRTFVRDDLDSHLYERRTLAKLRCVRNTIYVHPVQALPFVFRATVELATRGSERYMEARGISLAQFRTISEAIIALLKGADTAHPADKGHPAEMTASEIKETLHIELDIAAVLNLLCDQGVLIRARPEKSWRDRRQKYALFTGYFPGVDLYAMDEQEAIRCLVRYYLAAFGPATENDVVWWTGLGKRKIRTALADLASETAQVAIAGLGGEYIMLRSEMDRLHSATVRADPVVNLLPVLDPYIMGYKDRGRYLDERDRDLVFDRSGNGTSTIMVSGRVSGVWDTEDDIEPVVKLLLFRPVGRDVRDAIEAAARKLGCFIFDREADIRWCTSMVPLTERTAGSMMSPLKGCAFEN